MYLPSAIISSTLRLVGKISSTRERSYLVPETFGEVFLHPRNWDPVMGTLRP